MAKSQTVYGAFVEMEQLIHEMAEDALRGRVPQVVWYGDSIAYSDEDDPETLANKLIRISNTVKQYNRTR